MPSMVTLLRRGCVPRIWTYLPSPSSRSMVTLGKRPRASAMLALGRLVMTSAGSTCKIFSAVRSRLMASTSPCSRSARTSITSMGFHLESYIHIDQPSRGDSHIVVRIMGEADRGDGQLIAAGHDAGDDELSRIIANRGLP